MGNNNTLIYRAQIGDEGAFADLMREYYPFVYTVVIRIVDNPHDVEEVVQDTFLSAYRGLAQLEDSAKFKSWLAEIARNCARQWLRKRRIETRYPLMKWAKGYCKRRILLMSDWSGRNRGN